MTRSLLTGSVLVSNTATGGGGGGGGEGYGDIPPGPEGYGGSGQGGGMYATNDTLTLTDSVLVSSTAAGGGRPVAAPRGVGCMRPMKPAS